MSRLKNTILLLTLLCLDSVLATAQDHPKLILTQAGVELIQKEDWKGSLFEEVVQKKKSLVDEEIELGIDVPIPKDMAGGYTHERHKQNFFVMQMAGNLFQITQEEKYAIYIRDMLLAYAKIYPNLGIHPTNRSYATGKIFWQCLNDANWLVYTSQAYDCIYDWLNASDRAIIENQLLIPFADFISVENLQFFNRIHNHSTWGNAAVGMLGLVLDNDELINRALYGLNVDAELAEKYDNDGGLIRLPGQLKAGFFAQLDHAFSPDGYYTEGPYYQRYAISPFILFAKAIENNRPDLKIFEYRDGLLKKAVFALLYQTDAQGLFFPINDAQKGMSFHSRELISAVDIIYDYQGADPVLLSVAAQQGTVELDQSGLKVALGLKSGQKQAFYKASTVLRDGKDGTEGALGILRSYDDNLELCLAFKYTAQGLGHGHFDKLSYSFYDEKGEVIQDYGAARWVNIDQKAGGRYLKENTTWAKQTIAHNTVVINEASHFKGNFKTGNKYHSYEYFSDATSPSIQILSAKDTNAYPGKQMHRTMALVKDTLFQQPLLIDIFSVNSKDENQYDLALWFQGHLIACNQEYQSFNNLRTVLGVENGYQHLWKEAQGKIGDEGLQISWFGQNKFYTYTTAGAPNDEFFFARLGANDPSFNLRNDPCLVLRKQGETHPVFVSVLESHGNYSTVTEVPKRPYGIVKSVTTLHHDDQYTAIDISISEGKKWTLVIANDNNNTTIKHQLKLKGQSIDWKGPYHLIKNN